jgi:tungstate transport system substrate-binding protein
MRRLPELLLLLLMIFAGAACRAGGRTVAIATTTSVDGSGLLQAIRVDFEKQTGILLNAFVVGSGRALVMAAQNRVDVTITHDPNAERTFVATHHPEIYRQFMWNDFIIVGPPNDPAGVSAATSAADAFRRIHESPARFLSRNDQSGTHMKELALWRAAGVDPASNSNRVPMGQPMATLLLSADKMQAYTLSDRATFDQLAPKLHLSILFGGDPTLRNVYAIMLMRRGDSEEHRRARRFVTWVLSSEGRRIVETFQIRGRQELHWIEAESPVRATR